MQVTSLPPVDIPGMVSPITDTLVPHTCAPFTTDTSISLAASGLLSHAATGAAEDAHTRVISTSSAPHIRRPGRRVPPMSPLICAPDAPWRAAEAPPIYEWA